MKKYFSRLTSSARGEVYNPLLWPFLLTTLAYGVGFAWVPGPGGSSMYQAMISIGPALPFIWGWFAIVTILIGLTFLLFNKPPYGKASGLMGFMLWVFAALCYGFAEAWLPFWAIAIPNMWFWIWQYLSLSLFRRQDKADEQYLKDYESGWYDDKENPEEARASRKSNRGKDLQFEGSYENNDDGADSSRYLDSDG